MSLIAEKIRTNNAFEIRPVPRHFGRHSTFSNISTMRNAIDTSAVSAPAVAWSSSAATASVVSVMTLGITSVCGSRRDQPGAARHAGFGP